MPEEHAAAWYVWEPPGKPIRILLSLSLLDRLKAYLDKGLSDGRETGGVLLGRSEISSAGTSIVTLDDFLPVDSEGRRGDFYTLSGKDRKMLRTAMARRAGSAVGFFRGHMRPGLFLDASDFSIAREFFSAPDNVVLLVSPDPEPHAGFFIWEGGDISRHTTCLEFPFDRHALDRGEFTLIRGLSPVSISSASVSPRRRLLEIPRLVWGALAALLLITAGLWYWTLTRHDGLGVEASRVELNVQKAGKALRVMWTPSLQAIRRANRGVIWIKDGGLSRRMDLDAAELAKGSAVYVPLSNDVDFRLELIGSGENSMASVRSVSPRFEPAPSSPPAMAAPPPAPQPNRQEKPSVRKFVPPATGNADRAVLNPPSEKTSSPPVPQPPAVETPVPAPAPMAHNEPAPPREPANIQQPPWRHFTRRPSTVAVSYTVAPASLARRTFHKVPGLNLIEKVPGVHMIEHLARVDNESLLPPTAINSPVPQVPAAMARDLPGEHRIDFKTEISKHGVLRDVELLSRDADPRLAGLAASTLEHWRFEPATANGKDVPSTLIVTFRINNPLH